MKKIIIEITDLEWKTLADQTEDPGEWVVGAINAKISKCTQRILTQEQQRLLTDPAIESIPATVEGILESYFAQPGYRDNATRQEEEHRAFLNIAKQSAGTAKTTKT